MAITLDDLPFGYARSLTIEQQRDVVARVLATLRKHNITAAVFVVGSPITDRNRDFVDAVAAAGHSPGLAGTTSAFVAPDISMRSGRRCGSHDA